MKKGWQTTTLGDLCEFQRGLTYAKSDEVDVSDNIVLRATNIDLATNLLIFDELRYISDKVIVPESKKVKKGSLLICMASGSKSHLGKVAYIDDDYGYAFGGFMGMLTPLSGLMPKYLFHLMTSENYRAFIGALSDGANINNLTFNKLTVFPVPVPPLAEQQRIVGLLDEAIEGITTAKANTEKNLQNARALFESHLQSVFAERGWQTKTLDAACQFSNGLWKGEKPPFVNVGVIRNTNFTKHGTLDDSDIAYLDVEVKKLEKRRLQFGDIILEKSGGGPKQPVGRVALFDKHHGDFSFSNFTAALRVLDPDELDFRFLHNFLHWTYLSGVTEGMQSHSTGIRNLDGDAYKAIAAPVPPLAEQKRIVKLLDSLHKETQCLARLYEQKLAALEALKNSLLHQAFAGEL